MSRPLAQLLQTGARVGRYEIQGPLGAGGMGVVYRAWDPQLGRGVAVKLLDQLLPHSHEQQERFRREMRMASALNHPNVLAVFDAGEHGGSLYLVTELLVGQSLRAALRTQLPPLEQALDWGRQITRGLAAIHAHGIVHRDLKPENVFIREDGTVKILDFGIARAPAGSPGTTLTDSGAVLGTSGYMSPEQVRGTPADTRSDVFALGTLLYELLGGQPAFSGASPIECAYAVLNRDPAALPPSVPAQVRRVVQQCLAKDPEGRYRTANDVRLALEALADAPAGAGRPRSRWMLAPPGRRARRGLQLAALVLLALALALAGVQAWRPVPRGQEGAQLTLPPRFTRVTFRRGVGYAGRFGPEAQSVVFSASIGGKPTQTFLSLRGSPETRPIFDAGTSLVAVSARGKVVVRIPRLDEDERLLGEGLALSSLSGDAPKLLAPELTMVDFIPGTDELAGVRRTGDGFQLELPLGKVVLPLKRRVGGLRVSPDGQRVAWIALPEVPGLGATIEVVDRQGQQRSLTGPLDELNGIAWDARGEEVWFANRVDAAPSKDFELVAVSLEGQTRRVAVLPYWVVLHDIAKDGRVLLMWGAEEHRVAGRFPPAQHEVDLSWFDLSDAVDISSDGRQLLLGDSEGDGVGAYVRGTQGEAAVRLAHGWPLALAPKGDRALLLRRRLAVARVDDLWLVPTGAGEDRPVSIHPVRTLRGVFFFPDGESLLVVGMALGREPRIWLHRLKTGETTPLTEEGVMTAAPPSADGTRIVATSIDTGKSVLRSVRDGTETALPGLRPGDVPVHWAADGKSLFVRRLHVPGLPWEVPRSALISRPPPAVMLRYDLQQHRLHPWRELRPEGAVDIAHMDRVLINGDGSGYAYSYGTEMTNLFIVEGLR